MNGLDGPSVLGNVVAESSTVPALSTHRQWPPVLFVESQLKVSSAMLVLASHLAPSEHGALGVLAPSAANRRTPQQATQHVRGQSSQKANLELARMKMHDSCRHAMPRNAKLQT